MQQQLIAQLASMPDVLESLFSQVPPDRLNWLPEDLGGAPGEVFAALSHACHLRDIEIDGYHLRIRRMLEEHHPDLVSIDGDALARERHYERDDPAEVLRSFRRARERTLEMIRGLDEAALKRTGTFAEYGAITLGALIHYLRSHDHSHLAGLSWLLGKLSCGR